MGLKLAKLAVLNVVGLTRSLIGEHTPRIQKFLENGWNVRLEEPVPAVTCTSQANMLTGEQPTVHGIVGNGWYFKELAEVGFWKQNNGLVQSEKVWETLRKRNSGFTCAKLFWWYNMYSTADWTITPRPQYPADGRKVFGVYTQPYDMSTEIEKDLGPFPFLNFWGPGAGINSSKWIAESARWVFEKKEPDLNLVYLPHLDYGLQIHGPKSDKLIPELKAIDDVVGDLIDFYDSRNVNVVLLSEYGISEVNSCIHPNRILRENGFLKVTESLDWELLDAGRCRAFGVSDHQICHIYVDRKDDIEVVSQLFVNLKGVKKVISPDERVDYGLDHDRAGDVILLAEKDTWFSYYYWSDDVKASGFCPLCGYPPQTRVRPGGAFCGPGIGISKIKNSL